MHQKRIGIVYLLILVSVTFTYQDVTSNNENQSKISYQTVESLRKRPEVETSHEEMPQDPTGISQDLLPEMFQFTGKIRNKLSYPPILSPEEIDISTTGLGTAIETKSLPVGLNDLGQVAGTSYLTNGEERAFFWSKETGIVNLGTLGGTQSSAKAINNAGRVVGLSTIPQDTEQHIFLWSQAIGMIDTRIPFTRSINVWHNDIYLNKLGQIAGTSKTISGDYHAVFWEVGVGMIDLGTLGGSESYPRDFNDLGQITGTSKTVNGDEHAFFWSIETGMIDLGKINENDDWSFGLKINNLGHVAGVSGSHEYDLKGFMWSLETGMIDLGSFGSTVTAVTALNDLGQIAGYSKTSDGSKHAFRWTFEEGMVDIGSNFELGGFNLGGFTNNIFLNAHGMVAGEVTIILEGRPDDYFTRAFRWTEGGGMKILDYLGNHSKVHGFNKNGYLIGRSLVSRALSEEIYDPLGKLIYSRLHTTIWNKETLLIDLGPSSNALGEWGPVSETGLDLLYINSANQILGSLWVPNPESGEISERGYFVLTEDEYTYIDTLRDDKYKHTYIDNLGSYIGSLGFIFPEVEPSSVITDINNNGEVIGIGENDSHETQAVIWSLEKGIVDLGTLGGREGEVVAANDIGQVVGISKTIFGEQHSFFWSLETGMIDMGTLGGRNSYPIELNNLGFVVGVSETFSWAQHPFYWSLETGMVDMGIEGVPNDLIIDDLGQLAVEVESNVFFWSMDTGAIDIGSLGGNYASLFDMNDQG
ncbi:MAG: hypothetical protein ACXAC8_11755, partial [Candidatus Hodarchaeales archaeon]